MLSTITLAGTPAKNSRACRWTHRNCSMLWERVKWTYVMRLEQSTMTKKESRRRVEPTRTAPKLPQSTCAHSPGANWREIRTEELIATTAFAPTHPRAHPSFIGTEENAK